MPGAEEPVNLMSPGASSHALALRPMVEAEIAHWGGKMASLLAVLRDRGAD